MGKILDYILNTVFVPECTFCKAYSKDRICISCRRKINLSHGPWREGRDIYEFGDVYVTMKYVGDVRKRFIEYKFKGKYHLGKAFGEIMAENFKVSIEKSKVRPDIICYVPISKSRLKERGFDQSLEMCEIISKQLNLKLSKVLDNNQVSTRQSRLGLEGRLKNSVGRFKVKEDMKDEIINKNILLVDDILTTGSTLRECAGVLKMAGAANIDCMVFASGRGDIKF